MRRPALLGLLLCAHCAAPPEAREFALRVGVPLPLGALSPTKGHGSDTMAADLVYEPLLRPRPAGLDSRFLRRWAPHGSGGWRLEVGEGASFADGSRVLAEDVARSLRAFHFTVEREGELLIASAPEGADRLAALLSVQVFREGPTALGTGPFEPVEQGPGRIRLRRRQPLPRRPQAVEFVGAPSTRELFALLVRGEVDAVVPVEQAQEELLRGMDKYRVLRSVAPNALVVLFNPTRLSREQRIGLARGLPLAEIGHVSVGPGCGEGAVRPAAALPEGDLLQIGFLDYTEETRRAALALRRALGTRGGDLAAVGDDPIDDRLGLLVTMRLVWPPAMLHMTLADPALNAFRYANPRYEAALRAGNEVAADAALRDDPPLAVICRRERRAAVDARYRNATLGEWGALETLADWERTP